MDTFTIILILIISSLSATAIGLMFWMAMKNFEGHKYSITYVIILSIIFTPVVAWFISYFYKLPKNISALRSDSHKIEIIN